MKSLAEIKSTPRLLILREGLDGGWAEAHLNSSKKSTPAMVVFSWGGGWDHISVSFRNRTPTWEEMCEIKEMFFHPEEVCVQYHPAESEYVNNHPYCLHIWRLQQEAMPVPPSWMVGSKKGQTLAQAIKQGLDELTAMEAGQLEASQSKKEALSSHSERDIVLGCISLINKVLNGEFAIFEQLEADGFDFDDYKERYECELGFRLTYFEIVQRLLLYCTTHSGGTSTCAKCKELGFDPHDYVVFQRDLEDEADEE